MPKGWSKGHTKHTHPSVAKIAATMREKGIDNFKVWRSQARREGRLKSQYPQLAKDGDLAELVGVILGDGHIYRHARCESVRITGNSDNLGFTVRYTELLARVFQKQPSVASVKGANATTITLYEKHVSERLGIPSGSRSTHEYVVPDWIVCSREHVIRFLRGLYEAEGSLAHHAPTFTHKLSFSNRNPYLLRTVYDLVRLLGFNPHVSKYVVQISRKKEVQKLADLLQFRNYGS